MMVDLAALRSARPDRLDRAADAWSRLGASFGAQAAVLRTQVAQPLFAEGAWTGAAAGADPAEVSAWWKGLGADAQQRLIHEFPARIGALDGLPATARDEANRIVFAADYQRLKAEQRWLHSELAGVPSGVGLLGDLDPANPVFRELHDAEAQLSQVDGPLKGMDAIKSQLSTPGVGQNGLPPVYLLGFDTSNLGHVIISYGNPDTAQNVVSYVPGLGSKLANAASNMNHAATLWNQAQSFDPAARTASIYWLNYDAPQWSLSSLFSGQDVALPDAAQAAAPSLDGFAAGLAAAHGGAAAHTVMLGHSYGSLVVGEAATRAPSQLATDLVFVGSPGVGVNHAAQLDVPAGHVYAGEAGNDPVAHLGWFGTDPASRQFGGRTFAVDPGGLWPPGEAHSQYWAPESSSLRNLGYIVDGQYGQVAPGQPVIQQPIPGYPPGYPWIGPVHG